MRKLIILLVLIFPSFLFAQITKENLVGFEGVYYSFNGENYVVEREISFINDSLCKCVLYSSDFRIELLSTYEISVGALNKESLCTFNVLSILSYKSEHAEKQEITEELREKYNSFLNSYITFCDENNLVLRLRTYNPNNEVFLGRDMAPRFISKGSVTEDLIRFYGRNHYDFLKTKRILDLTQ